MCLYTWPFLIGFTDLGEKGGEEEERERKTKRVLFFVFCLFVCF